MSHKLVKKERINNLCQSVIIHYRFNRNCYKLNNSFVANVGE